MIMPFYVLSNPELEASDAISDYLKVGKVNSDTAPHCIVCHCPIALMNWLPPFRAEIRFWGKRHGDIAFGGTELLLSERFVTLWDAEKLVGLDILGPVEITKVIPKKMRTRLPSYFVGRVQHSRAVVDDIESGIDYEERWTCSECRVAENMLRIRRIVLEEDSWAGEDLFIARGLPGFILTSERFKKFCDDRQFANVKLINALDYSIDWTFGQE